MRFWKDKWCGEEPLCITFPSLFALASSKVKWVVDVWNSSVEGGGYTPCFSKPFNNWKVLSVEQFLLTLKDKRVYKDGEDEVLWIETKSKNFQSEPSFCFGVGKFSLFSKEHHLELLGAT